MTTRGEPTFSRGTALGLVLVGFAAFLAMLYFIGAGDTGERSRGEAHAAADGLNGYSGLVKLLELESFDVEVSRERGGLDTPGLLVITPPIFADPEVIGELLEDRRYAGPTLIVLPKWFTIGFPAETPPEIETEIEDDWVRLLGVRGPVWTKDISSSFSFEIDRNGTHSTEGVTPLPPPPGTDEDLAEEEAEAQPSEPTEPARWAGLGLNGALPTNSTLFAVIDPSWRELIVDQSGGVLAFEIGDLSDDASTDEFTGYPVFVIAEPDLANNLGLSDPVRAEASLRIFDAASRGDGYAVTFDLTLNGLGATTNLLTLAFRPPFLAATLCLLFAMLIIGWRSFNRFGPPIATSPQIAFGKYRLVTNGADLIVRARRLSLLKEPYAALCARRLSNKLGMTHHDMRSLDDALARRLNQTNLFTRHKEALISAISAKDILKAAQAMRLLEGKIET